MQVRIRLYAGLRERAGTDEVLLEGLPEGLDVAELKRALSAQVPALGSLEHVRGVLGTRYVPDDTPVPEGAEVALLPPVSGGAPDEDELLARGVFELCDQPLDPQACQRRVGDPSCGAIVVFTGTTRERNRERDVVRLDYEAFAEMAGTEMERIFAACRAEHGASPERALRMLCQHRTGTVGVGEASVVIAVASPHRDAAFAAARFLIDELKASVPLWKKEVYADGHHWVGDRS